jgi:hypothetical protein
MITRRELIAGACASVSAGAPNSIAFRAMYGSPKAFWARGAKLSDYGVNALFVHAGSITTELMERAAAEGARVFAEFPTLNGKGYVEKHEEAWPINAAGLKAPAATWFLGACPTDRAFREWRMGELQKLIERFPLSGVWMDYFHWHAQFEEPEPILPETCFNSSCIEAFEKYSRVVVPAGTAADRARWILTNVERKWREWRVEHLTGWAREVKQIVRARRPEALVGVYHCPWTDIEYDGARRRVLGLDFDKLASVVDVFSPMVYHGRMKRSPEWVGEYVQWMSRKLRGRKKIWPIVQAHEVSAAEFEKVLTLGTTGAATGVMMFTAQSIASDEQKMAAMQRIYRSLR